MRELVREQRALLVERCALEDAEDAPALVDRDLRDDAHHEADALLALFELPRDGLVAARQLVDASLLVGAQRAGTVALADLDGVAVEATGARRLQRRAVAVAPDVRVQTTADRDV